MGKKILLLLCLFPLFGISQITYTYQNNQSFTYDQAMDAYSKLEELTSQIKVIEYGKSDMGRPIHLVVFSQDKDFNPASIKEKGKSVLMINNAIHAGESCGVDATVKLFEYLYKHHMEYQNVVVCAIPVYNIGGMLNRSEFNRSGQPGPEECGFRGNYQNLDLNRDFIKSDSKNAKVFQRIFHLWRPDIFIDTHTTNGSDHQYPLTVILSQKDKMNPVLSEYVFGKFEPLMYRKMKERGKECIPYVYSINQTPDNGIKDFLDLPRYSSGYVNLFNTIGIITESHKYKSFKKRVEYTYEFLSFCSEFANRNYAELVEIHQRADDYAAKQRAFYANWELDTTQKEKLPFKGYENSMVTSELTGQSMIEYNRKAKKDMKIDFYRTYIPRDTIRAPKYYVVPQAYPEVIELLRNNQVKIRRLRNDTLIEARFYYIKKFETSDFPFEKHYNHSKVTLRKKTLTKQYYKGDYLIRTRQPNRRFIVEVLEPQMEDSYFNWNYFDNILMMKEWFSPFAFEPIAKQYLEDNPETKNEFEALKSENEKFANNHFNQLMWVFKRSPYYEKTHNLYPVGRVF